jgi:hypothetical protein
LEMAMLGRPALSAGGSMNRASSSADAGQGAH